MKTAKLFAALLFAASNLQTFGATLLGEIAHRGGGGGCCMQADQLTQRAYIMLLFGFRSANGGTKTFGFDADAIIGDQIPLTHGHTGFFDLDASNTPDFSAIVNRLTNGLDDDVALYTKCFGSSGNVSMTSGGHNYESQLLAGVNARPDLRGKVIDFVRLVISRVDISYYEGIGSGGPYGDNVIIEATWQFWSGAPVYSAAGQRNDVNTFLTFGNPLQSTTTLPAGTTSFDLLIHYGPTIIPASFQASVNGLVLSGFNPAPTTRQTLRIPLSSGRNTLTINVNGMRTDGHIAVERDHLVFIVP
jgi:hypothetical protein